MFVDVAEHPWMALQDGE